MGKIWVVAKKALGFRSVKKMLEENKLEFYITNQGDPKWEDLEEEIKEKMKESEIVYGVGIKGRKPENVNEVSKLLACEMDIQNYKYVIENVMKAIDFTTNKRMKNNNDEEIAKQVLIKQVENDIIEEKEMLEIDKYININTIDNLLGEVLISEFIETNSDVKVIKKTYYRNGCLWCKEGSQNITKDDYGFEKEFLWKEEFKIRDYILNFDEKLILLVNEGEFDDVLDYNIRKGPLLIIPEIIENIRVAKNDMALFDVQLESYENKKLQLIAESNVCFKQVDELNKELENMKNKLTLLEGKKQSKSVDSKKEQMNSEIAKKQHEYMFFMNQKREYERIIERQSSIAYQLGEIGSMVNNYQNEIDKYKNMYYESKIKQV